MWLSAKSPTKQGSRFGDIIRHARKIKGKNMLQLGSSNPTPSNDNARMTKGKNMLQQGSSTSAPSNDNSLPTSKNKKKTKSQNIKLLSLFKWSLPRQKLDDSTSHSNF